MAKTIQVRVDDDLKAAVDELYASLGLDTTTATRMFYMASLESGGLPFEVRHRQRKFSAETAQAMEDARRGRDLHGPYATAEEAIEAMSKD